jgi:hypothetical protein
MATDDDETELEATAEGSPEVEEAENDPSDADDDELLEKKYDALTRQIFPQKIELPIAALATMVAAQIDLAPQFQRRDVWDQKKQSKFIESLIMNVPVPPVFLGENAYGKYVVLDGRQRLTALVKFLNNEYKLVGLKVWKELNEDQFSDLQHKKLDVSLMRRFLPAVVLLKESSPEVKYDVFERLNTGGLNLNTMEIRNAVYRGKFTDLLHECAKYKPFRELWDIPGNVKEREKNLTYSRMIDLEQVLRFFALSSAQKTKPKRAAFKTYLGNFMSTRNAEYEADPKLAAADKQLFESAVDGCIATLGKTAFVRNGTLRSAPLADALMYALAPLSKTQRDDAKIQKAVQQARAQLLSDPSFLETLAQGTNGKAKIEQRLELAHAAVQKALATAK